MILIRDRNTTQADSGQQSLDQYKHLEGTELAGTVAKAMQIVVAGQERLRSVGHRMNSRLAVGT